MLSGITCDSHTIQQGDKGEDEAVIIKSLLFIDLVLIKLGDIFHSNMNLSPGLSRSKLGFFVLLFFL